MPNNNEYSYPAVEFERAVGLEIGTVSQTYVLPEGLSEHQLEDIVRDFELEEGTSEFKPKDKTHIVTLESLYQKLLSLNPCLSDRLNGTPSTFNLNYDVLRGVCSKFNVDDIVYFNDRWTVKSEQADEIMREQRRLEHRIGEMCEWIVSPETQKIIKQNLKQIKQKGPSVKPQYYYSINSSPCFFSVTSPTTLPFSDIGMKSLI